MLAPRRTAASPTSPIRPGPNRWLRRAAVPAGVLATLAAASLTPVAITAAVAATANPSPSSGARENATRLSFYLSGTASLSVDVATGNALISDQLLTLPGINGDVPVAASFNSAAVGTAMPSSLGAAGNGWVMSGFDQRLVANADGSVTYYGPSGLTGVFTPVAGSSPTTYNQPSSFQADLKAAASGGGWTLVMHQSQSTSTFNAAGVLTSVKDRNSNTTTFNLDPYNHPASIVTPRGAGQGQYATGSTTATVSTSGGRITKVAEAAAGLSRSVSVGYDSSTAKLTSVTDAVGGVTTFGYGTGTATSPTNQIVSITNPSGEQTTLTYSGAKVTAVAQTNTATGSPGTSSTRLVYNAASGSTPAQTLVADPTTNQSQAVSAVAHTTYSIDAATTLVSSVVDADGHSQGATYNPQNNVVMTQTNSAQGTTSYTYGANAQPGQSVGESLTASQSPGGASSSAKYTGTGQSQYEPNSVTNSAGNALVLTYNNPGNQLTSAQNNVTANVGYNGQGQATSSQSPGAAQNVQTTYTYDGTSHNLTTITPVTGTNLGTRAYTWDGFGRLATATDGRGHTTTYSYDNADRVTSVAYSDSTTHGVTYTYDAENRPTQRVDGSGTTTWTYDDLGRMTSMANTAGGGTETYRYDLAGALASKADTSGTTSYTYTPGHRVATMSYPQGTGGNLTTMFAYDSAGRRSDIWMQTTGGVNSNGAPNGWAGHEHTTYDTSGRVTNELGQEGPASSPTTVVNQTACYNTGSQAPTCGTGPTGDQAKIQFITDAVSGETAVFGYDNGQSGQGQTGRLLTTKITGGSNPRIYTYAYNAAGDRTTASVTGSSPSTQSLSFNNANQITSTGYTYDGSGNQTANPTNQASYNTAGQQTTTTSTGGTVTSYTYAGTNNDELLSETNNNVTYHLVYGKTDQSGLPEIEQLSANGNTAYVQHDPTTGAPLMLQTSSGVNCLYMTDITGNPILLSTSFQTTSFAESYDPYGSATQTGGTTTNGGVTQNPYLYHFGLQDRVTGKVKFGGRFYDPTTGSWTQQDTLNAPLSPGNANRYLYGGGDPINAADPTGDDIWDDVLSGVSFAAGVAGTVLDATGVGAPAGLILGGISAAAGVAQAGYDCGTGSSSCGESAVLAGVGAATFGLGAGLGDAGNVGADIAGDAASGSGAASTYYCDAEDC